MSNVIEVIEVIEQIEALAKEQAAPELRCIEKIAVGQIVRQGDVYLHRVEDTHAAGKQTTNRQLAIGTTMGSRHVAESPAQVFTGTHAPKWAPNALLGPLVKSKRRFIVSHPEHAHLSLPAGSYQVTHQMDVRTLEHVAD